MRQRHSAEQWLEWLEAQPGSGLTIVEFCDAVGVSQNAFYSWRKKLAGVNSVNHATAPSCQQSFLPLTIVPSRGIEIDLPCGATMRVPMETAAVQLVMSILLKWEVSPSC